VRWPRAKTAAGSPEQDRADIERLRHDRTGGVITFSSGPHKPYIRMAVYMYPC